MASSVPVNGYLYTAYGELHVAEAVASVACLREVDSTAHVTLVSDRYVDGFDKVEVKGDIKPGFAGKVQCITNEHYTTTLYLDSDTYVCEDPSGLFELSYWFDVCAAPDPAEIEIDGVAGLVACNTGVVLYGQATDRFLAKWKELYFDELELTSVLKGHPAEKQRTDQPSFLQALMQTDTKFHSLPNVWNARYRFNTSLMGSVKIIHGNTTDYESVRTEMNATRGNRIWEAKR